MALIMLKHESNITWFFDVALDIVVQCARKTDAAYWQFLFDGVGDPKVLFEDCMAAGKFGIAASYLKILQSMCITGYHEHPINPANRYML